MMGGGDMMGEGDMMGSFGVGADSGPMNEEDTCETDGDETWRDAGELGLAYPSQHKEKANNQEWACDIMKRLLEAGGEGSDVGDSDEDTPPPQVFRSVTQELESTVDQDQEEQPPLVGRAHTSEF